MVVSGSSGNGYLLQLYSNDKICAYQSVDGNFYKVMVSAPFPHDNYYHHVVMTFESGSGNSTLKLYIDGVEAGSNTAIGVPDLAEASSNILIGSSLFTGDMSDMCFFSRALTSGEVLKLYEYSQN